MPVSNIPPNIKYTANGASNAYAYPFRILKLNDIKVSINGVVQTTGYTVSGIGLEGGGQVTISPTPAVGKVIYIYREVELDRTNDYISGGILAANTLDDDLDRIVMQIQDLYSTTTTQSGDGQLNANGKRVANVADPINPQDATTTKWVLDNGFGSGAGQVNANGKRITNVADPIDPQDATTKKWVLDNILGDGVIGPISSTDNCIARYDGISGKILQNSGVVITDNGNLGIGTSTPATKLEVTGGRVTLNGNSEPYVLALKYSDASSGVVYLGCGSDGAFSIRN
jgi:hypothetical protein